MKKEFFVMACLLVLSSFAAAELEQIVWGDYVGITVKYNGVSESSTTDTLDINNDSFLDSGNASVDGLYGRPRLDGDSLAFDDLDFFSYSTSSGSYASDTTDGKLAGQIEGKPSYYVNQIRFTEYGDATVTAPFAGMNGYASIANNIFIKIQAVDGIDIPDITFDPISMVVNPQSEWSVNGTYTWSGSLLVDVTALLRAWNNGQYANSYATLVDFSLDNTLTTAALNGSGYIAKKESGGLVVETFNQDNGIPEPATMVLLGLGALALLRKRGK